MAEPPTVPLVIYDTNIILQATLNPQGVSEVALAQIVVGNVAALMSPRLRSEYEEILSRLSTNPRYARFLAQHVREAQLVRIDRMIRLVPNAPEQVSYPRDPSDAPTINLAIFYNTDYIVARDNDLLTLDTDPVLRRRAPGLRIVDPVAFLAQIAPEVS